MRVTLLPTPALLAARTKLGSNPPRLCVRTLNDSQPKGASIRRELVAGDWRRTDEECQRWFSYITEPVIEVSAVEHRRLLPYVYVVGSGSTLEAEQPTVVRLR